MIKISKLMKRPQVPDMTVDFNVTCVNHPKTDTPVHVRFTTDGNGFGNILMFLSVDAAEELAQRLNNFAGIVRAHSEATSRAAKAMEDSKQDA